jgi:ABC-type oligopeptide transport system substrate-binding subunit
MTTSSRRLAARTLFGLLCVTLLLGASFLGGGKTSARAYAATPTIDQRSYYCPNEGRFLSIDWTTPMPQNGWLGQANAYPQLVDVQAYDARPLSGGGLNWGFQAQNGSFVCRMYVSGDRYTVSFVNCNNANWQLSSCFAL